MGRRRARRGHPHAAPELVRHWAEGAAKTYLLAQGYRILAENYTVRGAEIDLVAEKGGVIVVAEVKQRRSDRYGAPAETITAKKLARLQVAALHFVSERFGRDDLPLRFDALLVSGDRGRHRLEHLQGIS